MLPYVLKNYFCADMPHAAVTKNEDRGLKEQPVILAIESSCDETSAAVSRNGKILSNIIATQKVHEQYGGVVPELASRAHMQHIVPVVDRALEQANCDLHEIDGIAFTRAPGLIGSLLVGSQFAKS